MVSIIVPWEVLVPECGSVLNNFLVSWMGYRSTNVFGKESSTDCFSKHKRSSLFECVCANMQATLQQLPSVVVADASAMGPLIVHRKSTSDEHEEKVTVPFGGVACGASLPQYYAAIALQIPDPFDYEVTTKLRTTTWADTVFEQDVILNRIAVAAALAEKPEDISLGFELSLTEIADGGLVAVVCSVALGSMAAAALGGDGMHVGDRILAVNGTSLAELPLGSAGRIYLFRLLSAKVVQLRVCIQRLVKGYEDVRTGTFTPDNAAFLAYDGHTKT
eukprot:m.166716 g.166716  ORF g.166716 m.166716 type:complete len:276 (-) comp18164_c0_seq2:133-960(-)